ncbi:MAG: hypothetical protein ABSD57_00135 [Verrucomicrobiota bacterium]
MKTIPSNPAQQAQSLASLPINPPYGNFNLPHLPNNFRTVLDSGGAKAKAKAPTPTPLPT